VKDEKDLVAYLGTAEPITLCMQEPKQTERYLVTYSRQNGTCTQEMM